MNNLGATLWEPPNSEVSSAFAAFQDLHSESFFRQFTSTAQDGGNLPECLSWLSNKQLADHIKACIRNSQPASYIRLSDGEGNIVALRSPFGADDVLVDWCARRISYIHFGDHGVVPRDRDFFAGTMSAAMESADVIGFAEFDSVLRSFATPPEKLDVRAAVGNRISLLYLKSRIEKGVGTTAASAWFSRGLLPHYKDIVQAARRVCIVSTYPDLVDKISSAFSIPKDRISFLQIPVQAVFVPTKERKDTCHYPDAMRAVVSSIKATSEPTLFLVAAGLLGKHYCNLAKLQGGIGIDIGSIAEIWLGIQARGIAPEFIKKWKL